MQLQQQQQTGASKTRATSCNGSNNNKKKHKAPCKLILMTLKNVALFFYERFLGPEIHTEFANAIAIGVSLVISCYLQAQLATNWPHKLLELR